MRLDAGRRASPRCFLRAASESREAGFRAFSGKNNGCLKGAPSGFPGGTGPVVRARLRCGRNRCVRGQTLREGAGTGPAEPSEISSAP